MHLRTNNLSDNKRFSILHKHLEAGHSLFLFSKYTDFNFMHCNLKLVSMNSG